MTRPPSPEEARGPFRGTPATVTVIAGSSTKSLGLLPDRSEVQFTSVHSKWVKQIAFPVAKWRNASRRILMQRVRGFFRWLLGGLFIAAGVLHFATPAFFVRIVPPYLPWPEALVAVSGVCEVAFGVLVLVPRYASRAGWGLVALLAAVFPANVHMALNPEAYPQFPPALLWGRLPLQLVFMTWAIWATRTTPARADGRHD